MIGDRCNAASEKPLKHDIERDAGAMTSQDIRQTAAGQHLAIGEDAVTIEDDEIEATRLGTHDVDS